MKHWTEHNQIIMHKVAAMYKLLGKDHFLVGNKLIQDYACSKLLCEIDEKTWQQIYASLTEKYGNEHILCDKVNMLLCYLAELRRLACINVKELTGLTRDDIAALQRLTITSKAPIKNKNKVVEVLTTLVSEYADADINDRTLLTSANKHE